MHATLPRLCGIAAFIVAVVAFASSLEATQSGYVFAQGRGKDSATIKMVMQKAMKGGLAQKFATGNATNDEKAELLVLFTNLAGCDCPKGDEKSWREKTSAILAAITAGDTAEFKKAMNCAACHREHK